MTGDLATGDPVTGDPVTGVPAPGRARRRAQRLSSYAADYAADYGFESVLVRYRHRLVADLVRDLRPATVVEVGCGLDLLVDAVRHLETRVGTRFFGRWVVVEPDPAFAAPAEAAARSDARLAVVRGFAEDAVGEVARRLGPGNVADLVVCASLLHELDDPARVLGAVRSLSGPATVVHVSVPNAGSLHRRLARSMGLIGDVHQPSERNRRFGQPHVFDRDSLAATLASAGFDIVRTGGAFVKPFDHRHMEQVPFLTPDLLDGLYELGRELPELAAEIYADARLAAPAPP